MSSLSLEITPLSRDRLNQLMDKAEMTTILQSFSHAIAVRETQFLETHLGIIKKDMNEIGFFLLQEGGFLWSLFHVIILDRGPIWFVGENTLDNNIKFVKLLSNKYKKRFGRKRRWLIEHQNKTLISELTKHNWHQHPIPPYKTCLLDLTKDLTILEENYHKKWLSSLNKARNQDLNIRYDYEGAYLNTLLKNYTNHKSHKGYQGPSLAYLKSLFTDLCTHKNLLCVIVSKGRDIHSIIALPIHGKTATYQTGWTSEEGRKTQANYLALHTAISHLKEKKITYLDLGGINDEHAEGVTRFKKRMNGETIELIGQFG